MNNDKDAERRERDSIQFLNQNGRNKQCGNALAGIIEVLKGDKCDLDKVKVLIELEQEYKAIKDKMRMFTLFKVLSDCLNQSESTASALFKGQILMTSTTLIILLHVKTAYPLLFHNFIDNILIEHLKNTSNPANLYLRQIACLCLDELEVEYPGMLFGLMGQRTLEIVDSGRIGGSALEDMKSARSYMPSSRRVMGSVRESSGLRNIEQKKAELANDGLYLLIDEERYFVFQYYLLLYTRVLNHLIMLYIEKGKSQKEASLGQSDTQLKELNENLSKHPELLARSSNSNESTTNYLYPFSNPNLQHLNMQNEPNTALHIGNSEYQLHIDLYDKTITSQTAQRIQSNTKISSSTPHHAELFAYMNKSLSFIIHLLPKTTECIKARIWQIIAYVISHIEINQIALLPHFNYFHLNNSSQVLTLVIIPIISQFKASLKQNFILKLVAKLCLLINDIRLNEALRILSLRWLLSLRSTFAFDFGLYLKTISYYLSPTPFDSLEVRNEKLRSLFIFLEHQRAEGSEFIINSLDIFDNYKYYPIFSKHVKSLFKAYLFLVIRFPYKSVVKLLGVRLATSLKEVPRLLPNVINLLRNIKALSYSIQTRKEKYCDDKEARLRQMPSGEIYSCLLVDMASFISNYTSHARLSNYFELFIEIAKENSIDPFNLIKALRNLYNSIRDTRNWKAEKNILEVSKYLMEYHSLDIIKRNYLTALLKEIKTRSFDYGIREQARLYYELAENVEKPLLIKFISAKAQLHQEIDVTYNYCDLKDSLSSLLLLEQSKEERMKAKLNDRGTAIYDCGCEPNKLFLSNYKSKETKENLLIQRSNEKELSYEKLNDYSKRDIDDLVNAFIGSDDILRLFVPNEKIDLTKDALIPHENIFSSDNDNTTIDSQSKAIEQLNISTMKENYYQMIAKTRFYIKLPLNISLQSSSSIEKMYSITLCFSSVPHLDIKTKLILPYLEKTPNERIEGLYHFPYFYKTYLIAYPQYPIPSEIKARAIFYDEKGKCCTGLLHTVHISFEDYFLPITVPQQYREQHSEFRAMLFKILWKQFKEPTSLYINTSRLFEIPKHQMIEKVNQNLFPFLTDQFYEKQLYVIQNPFTETIDSEHKTKGVQPITKIIYNRQSCEFTKTSYGFSMDSFLEMNSDQISNSNGEEKGEYILAKAIIFLPKHFHLLFKIKVSLYSSIMEVRNDCPEVLQYLDDYFDSWEE